MDCGWVSRVAMECDSSRMLNLVDPLLSNFRLSVCLLSLFTALKILLFKSERVSPRLIKSQLWWTNETFGTSGRHARIPEI